MVPYGAQPRALDELGPMVKIAARNWPLLDRLANMPTPLDAERHDLVTTLRGAGPTAPTLCTGWDARTLLAHLIRRERSPLELIARARVPGIAGPAEEAMESYAKSHSFSDLLTTFDSGPPFYSVFGFGPTREALNLLEYVIHHEDVRRAVGQAAPRVLDQERERAVLRRLRAFARFTMRSSPVSVQFRTPDGASFRAGDGGRAVVVTGRPVELALVAFGRQRVAEVDYSGPEEAIAALVEAKLGT
jgi:uncharacterized protein (TIGR03085 family)